MTPVAQRRPRDPAGRRQAILEAAERVITERGLGELTHRRVAAEANVPVGSTTYYFRDLAALREAALAHAAISSAEDLQRWRHELRESPDLPATLARLTTEYLTTSTRHQMVNELYLAASHQAELQRLARLWPEGLVALLEPRVGRPAAEAIKVFLDGAMLHTIVTGTPLRTDALEDGIARLAVRARA